jgi:hypothetical protein
MIVIWLMRWNGYEKLDPESSTPGEGRPLIHPSNEPLSRRLSGKNYLSTLSPISLTPYVVYSSF